MVNIDMSFFDHAKLTVGSATTTKRFSVQLLLLASWWVSAASAAGPPPASAAPPQARPPSVAVFALEPKNGVNRDSADLLTENLVQEIRRARAFSRVVSAKEIETVLGLEQRKQMMNCSDSSCVAELADSLGVDFVLAGTVGRLGEYTVLNLQLVSAKTGVAVGSVSEKFHQRSEAALLEAVPPAVTSLLNEAGLTRHPAVTPVADTPAVAPAVRPSVAEAGVADGKEADEEGGGRGMWLVLGAVGAAGAALTVPLGAALSVGAYALVGTVVFLSQGGAGAGVQRGLTADVVGNVAAAGVFLLVAVPMFLGMGGLAAAGFLKAAP